MTNKAIITREMPVRPDCEWFRCQVGITVDIIEQHPIYQKHRQVGTTTHKGKAFKLLGFGPTEARARLCAGLEAV